VTSSSQRYVAEVHAMHNPRSRQAQRRDLDLAASTSDQKIEMLILYEWLSP